MAYNEVEIYYDRDIFQKHKRFGAIWKQFVELMGEEGIAYTSGFRED